MIMYVMIMRNYYSAAFYRYLPTEAHSLIWGLHVMDAGHALIPPGTPYPTGQHPAAYVFSWERGRRLHEYQLVYISEGSGQFESKSTGVVSIKSGDVFFLHPGVWHRFRPDPAEGWAENWFGFSGDVATRIMRHFFPAKKPVIHVGIDQELLHLIQSIAGLMSKAPPGHQQLIAARAMEALALVRCRALKHHTVGSKAADIVHKAQLVMLQNSAMNVDMRNLAAELGLSYSRFRSMFKQLTGMAPHHYLIDIRLNKACYLLRDSDLAIEKIAEITGFSSQFYFSRLFRKRKQCTPSAYRGKGSANEP